MKRLGRRMLNALTALSLGLCVVSLALWAWTHLRRGYDVLVYEPARTRVMRQHCFGTRPGWLFYCNRQGVEGLAGWHVESPGPTNVFWAYGEELDLFGLPAGVIPEVGARSIWFDGLPLTAEFFHLWLPSALFGLVPAVRGARRVRRWRRRRPRRCVVCAYDLTGNVSGVCPECGRAIVKHAP